MNKLGDPVDLSGNKKYLEGARTNDLELMQEGLDLGAYLHQSALTEAAVYNHIEACQFAIDHGTNCLREACMFAKLAKATDTVDFLTAIIRITEPNYPNGNPNP